PPPLGADRRIRTATRRGVGTGASDATRAVGGPMRRKRAYGTGSLYVRRGAGGSDVYYGRWMAGSRKINRRIGPVRPPGGRDGLTRSEAEAELRRLIAEIKPGVMAGQ